MIRKLRRLLKRAEDPELKARTIAPHMVWAGLPFFADARRQHGHVRGIPDLRLFFLQSCLRSLTSVDGDIAECGTRFGKSALFMLEALDRPRHMYLFDSFEGLSDPTPGKDSLSSAFDRKSGERLFHNDAPEEVIARFADRDVTICRGWIPERFAEVADRKFCLVHVDVDLYQPTYDSLAFFYPRLSPGGMIICDDYGSGNYPGARAAMDEFFADLPEKPAELPQGQAFVVRRG